MQITLDKQDTTNASINITLQEADYQPKVNEKLKEYGKKASLKGFRPGKVPPTLIKKMFGKSVLVEEINGILSEAVSSYIRENKLSIVGDPLPDQEQSQSIDWDGQTEFDFRYNVGLVPEFAYNFDALQLNQYDVQLDEQAVQESMTNLQERYGNYTQKEITQEKDFLIGSLRQVDGAFTKDKAYISLDLLKEEALPQFVGINKGEAVSFRMQEIFKDSDTVGRITGLPAEEAANLDGTFEFIVDEIDHMEPALLDQDFFDKVLGKETVQSEEEFRNKLRELLQDNYRREADRSLTGQIQQQLVDTTDITLPDDFLKKWLLLSNKEFTAEQIEREYDSYVRELKWNLIKNKVAEDAEIKVEHEEVLSRTKELIRQQFGGAGVGEQLEESMNAMADNFLKAEKGKNYMNIFDQVYTSKIIEYVKNQAPVVSKMISAEEFKHLEA